MHLKLLLCEMDYDSQSEHVFAKPLVLEQNAQKQKTIQNQNFWKMNNNKEKN